MSVRRTQKRVAVLLLAAFLALGACNLAGPGGGPADQAPAGGTEESGGGGNGDPSSLDPLHDPNPRSVTFQPEDTSESVDVLPETGGSVSVTDQQGITYTLTVPGGSVVSAQTVTITPYASILDAPVGSSFRYGVELQPEGLELLEPATLEIDAPSGLPAGGAETLVGFGAESSGEEFYFTSIGSASGTTVSVPVHHFSGAGAMEATDSEVRQQQNDHPPTDVRDWAEQELVRDPTIEVEVATMRAVHAQTLATIGAAGSSPILMDQAFQQYRFWRLKYTSSRSQVQAQLTALDADLLAQFVTTFELALVQSRAACRNHDLSQIGRLLRWSYLVLTYPDISAALTDAQSIQQDAVDCAKFELEFDSYIEAYAEASDGDPIITAVSGTIPVGSTVAVPTGISLAGDGALDYTQTKYFSYPDCIETFSGNGGTLDVLKVDLGVNLDATSAAVPAGSPVIDLGVYLVPQGLSESLRIACSGQVILEQDMTQWLGGWASLHLDENSANGFEIRGWIPGSAGDPVVGTKTYNGSNESFSEQTELRLIHKPTL
jgi:hypothetical protein